MHDNFNSDIIATLFFSLSFLLFPVEKEKLPSIIFEFGFDDLKTSINLNAISFVSISLQLNCPIRTFVLFHFYVQAQPAFTFFALLFLRCK